jgi:hypothetical protein
MQDQHYIDVTVTCRWFALCDHDATGVIPHPVLGPVPACQRCAAKTGEWLRRATFSRSPAGDNRLACWDAETGELFARIGRDR